MPKQLLVIGSGNERSSLIGEGGRVWPGQLKSYQFLHCTLDTLTAFSLAGEKKKKKTQQRVQNSTLLHYTCRKKVKAITGVEP